MHFLKLYGYTKDYNQWRNIDELSLNEFFFDEDVKCNVEIFPLSNQGTILNIFGKIMKPKTIKAQFFQWGM